MKIDYIPPEIHHLETKLMESSAEAIKLQAIKQYESRNRQYIALGVIACIIICGMGFWYWYEPDTPAAAPVPHILEEAGHRNPDILEEEEAPMFQEPREKRSHQKDVKPFVLTISDDSNLYTLAQQAFNEGNWPGAIAAYKKLNSLYPYDVNIIYNLALAFHYAQELPAARLWYQKVLELNPHHPGAMRNLSFIP